MGFGRGTLVAWIVKRLEKLRFPTLFLVTGGLFLVNLIVPDALPFVDELLLGLATAMLGSLRARKSEPADAASDSRARLGR